MPDNNGNLTDKLSVEISASVNPAIKAIDSLQTKLNLLSGSLQHFTDAGKYKSALDNMASGFERLNAVVGSIDTGSIASTAKAIGAMGGSFEKVAKSALTFQQALGGVEKAPKTVADVVGEQMVPVLDKFGVTAKKDVDLVISEFTKLGESVSRGVWDKDLDEKFDNAQRALQSVATVAKETTQTYAGLLEYIRSFPKASVHLPQEVIAEYPDNAWLGKAKTAGGNIFTTSGGTDFSTFISELNGQLGNIIPMTGNAADEFTALTNAMRIARDEAEELKNGGSRMGISMREAGDETYQAMTNIQEALKGLDGSEKVEKLVSPFNDLKGALQELSTITVPNFSNLDALGKAVEKFGGEKGTNAGANIAPVITAIQTISGTEIPNFEGLTILSKAIEKLGNDKSVKAGETLPALTTALRSLSGISIPDFSGLTALSKAIEKLGNNKSQNAAWVLPNVMAELQSFSGHFNGLSLDGSVIETISKLGSAFGRLGNKNATEAITNLPQLSDAIRQVVDDLNNLPEVSEKTQDLIVALGQLAKSHGNTAKAVKDVTNGHNLASQAIQRFTSHVATSFRNTNVMASVYGKVSEGVSSFIRSIDNVKSHTQSFTMMVIKARTMVWMFRRVFNLFSQPVELASSLVEVQNVIDNVFTENYAAKIEDMSKSVKDSLGMSELSFKQYASRYQAMGKAMGITNSQMISAQDRLKSMGVAYGEANGNMQDMSVNLTELAADLASFYDIDQKTAFEKLQAVYTGQTRPLNVAA